jgi:HlyD family secretion protein
MKRLALFALPVLLLALGCDKKTPEPAEETTVVGPATLRDVISQTGEVAPVVKVDLKCEASGTIEKIYVKEGQSLQKGEKILVIDPTRLRTSKEKLDLQVQQAGIERDQAQRALKRAQDLAASGSVSQKQLEDLKSSFDLADISYRQRVLERRDVADQLAKTTVVAPMTGIMTSLDVQEGEIAVSATSGYQTGTAIGTIADITNLEVITQIGEADYTRLRKGQSVVIKPEAAEGLQTRGTISFISLAAKKKGSDELGTFEVRISVDSLIVGIVPGVNVHVEFVVLEKKVDLAVPYHYVQKKDGTYTVLVRGGGKRGGKDGAMRAAKRDSTKDSGRPAMGDGPRGGTRKGAKGSWMSGKKSGRSRPVEVQVGATDYRNYEVVSGLSAGDSVVYKPPRQESEKEPRGPGGGGRR